MDKSGYTKRSRQTIEGHLGSLIRERSRLRREGEMVARLDGLSVAKAGG